MSDNGDIEYGVSVLVERVRKDFGRTTVLARSDKVFCGTGDATREELDLSADEAITAIVEGLRLKAIEDSE